MEETADRSLHAARLVEIPVPPEDHALSKQAGEERPDPGTRPVWHGVHDDCVELAPAGPSDCAPLPHEWAEQVVRRRKAEANEVAECRGGNGVEILMIVADECEVRDRTASECLDNGSSIMRIKVIDHHDLRSPLVSRSVGC